MSVPAYFPFCLNGFYVPVVGHDIMQPRIPCRVSLKRSDLVRRPAVLSRGRTPEVLKL